MSAQTDYFELSECLNDDIVDISIVLWHFMRQTGSKSSYREIYEACEKYQIDKYEYAIECALETPIPELLQISAKNLLIYNELKAQFKAVVAKQTQLTIKKMKAQTPIKPRCILDRIRYIAELKQGS